MNKKNNALEERLRMNKVFIYMIIHDLKHPTECIVTSLKHMDAKLVSMISEHKSNADALEELLAIVEKCVEENVDLDGSSKGEHSSSS
jgi:hypothetical protein